MQNSRGRSLALAKRYLIGLGLFVVLGIAGTAATAAAGDYAASGTYSYSSGSGPGPLSFSFDNSSFLCNGPTFPTDSYTVTSLTATTMIWQDGPTWTRASGSDGVIDGTWSMTDGSNSYSMTFDAGSVSMAATVLHCGIDGVPTISSFSPSGGPAGSLVTINGGKFSPIAADNTVTFNGMPALVRGVQPGKLFVLVPSGASSGPVSVTNSGGIATSSTSFTVNPGAPAATLSWGGTQHRIGSDGVEYDALDAGTTSNATSLAGLTLTVSGPDGFSYTFTDSDLQPYINGQLAVYRKYPTPGSSLASGVYTFTLDDHQGHVSHRVDTHVTALPPLPQVDSATIQLQRKADGSYRVSWAAVNDMQTYHYRVRIALNNSDYTPVYDSTRAMTTFADVPAGILFDDATYLVRIETCDSPNGDLVTNRSDSTWKLFSPKQDDYNPNRLLTNYAAVYNRTNSGAARTFDTVLGVSNPDSVTSILLTGPGFSQSLDPATNFSMRTPDGTTQIKDFTKNFAAMTPGLYTFTYVANGVTHKAYATLTAPVTYNPVDVTTMQAQDLNNGNIRFSWANADNTGAVYYRVTLTGANSTSTFYATSRQNQAFADVPKSIVTGTSYPFTGWRVELYDSSDVTTQRNRFHSAGRPITLSAYDSARPVINSYRIRNTTSAAGAASAQVVVVAASQNTLTQVLVTGPGGYSRDLTTVGRYSPTNGYTLDEPGTLTAGLYTIRITDTASKTDTRYVYVPDAHPLPRPDFRTFHSDMEPNGDMRISWAPVVADIPVWYSFRIFAQADLNGDALTDSVYSQNNVQQSSIVIPAATLAGMTAAPKMVQGSVSDGSGFSVTSNVSLSVMVGAEMPGFDYSNLADADGDGFANDVDANDSDPGVYPFAPHASAASGTYTYTGGADGGLLTWTLTDSSFICDGPPVGLSTETITAVTATVMSWTDSHGGMTWTRAGGTDGDIVGTWTSSETSSGNTYTLTFNGDGTIAVTGDIYQCGTNGSPAVSSFGPAGGPVGSLITVNGWNFSPLPVGNTVTFNGMPATVTGVQPGKLFVLVPSGATTGTISVITSSGIATSSTPFTVTPGFPAATLAWGGVHHRIDGNGVEYDALDAGISSYAPSLAGLTLTVTGPKGFSYTFNDADLQPYINGQLAVYSKHSLLHDTGVYTFTLDDGQGHISHRVDNHVAAAALPRVDNATIQLQRKGDGSYRISWAAVNDTRTYNYRVRIARNNSAYTPVYDSPRAMTTFADVPAGILFDDCTYLVRVETFDSPDGDLATSRSDSAWKPFTPKQDDYNSDRLLTNYAVVYNRTNSGGVQTVDVLLGVSNPASVTSIMVTGPGGFSQTLDPATNFSMRTADGVTQIKDFTKNFTSAMTPGLYTFTYVANGITHTAYATLTPPVTYPAVDATTMQAQDLGNGYTRFSWANANRAGALYYRVMLLNSSNANYATARLNQAYVDIANSYLTGSFAFNQWRVEVYDSDDVTTQRNRFNSPNKGFAAYPVQAYDPARPVITNFLVLNQTSRAGYSSSQVAVAVAAQSTLTQILVTGPGYSRDLLADGRYSPPTGQYLLEEPGPLTAGLYTITVTAAGKTATRYMYAPTAHPLPQPDFTTFHNDLEPNGDMRISWAPVVNDVPVWYSLWIYARNDQNGDGLIDLVAWAKNFQQNSIVIPAAMVAGMPQSLMAKITATDGSTFSVTGNVGQSVTVGVETPGFDYAGLADADGDGYASNVDLDSDPSVYPFSTGNDSLVTAVSGVYPANLATGVATGSSISVTFNKVVDQRTLPASFTLDNGATGTIDYNPGTMTATLTPSTALLAGTVYTATISTSLKDQAGNALSAPYSWSFTTAGLPNLSLTVVGKGQINGTFTCSSGSCSEPLAWNTPVSLFASPSYGSVFANWSGACTGTDQGLCSFNMDAAKSVTATFNALNNIRLSTQSGVLVANFDTLKSAYTDNPAIADGYVFNLVQAGIFDFTETLTMDKNYHVTLKGGFDSGFAVNSGLFSKIKGPLTIRSGSLTIENIIVTP